MAKHKESQCIKIAYNNYLLTKATGARNVRKVYHNIINGTRLFTHSNLGYKTELENCTFLQSIAWNEVHANMCHTSDFFLHIYE